MPAAYDEVPYPDFPYEITQPDRAAAMAILHGLTPPAPERARVLELGCGAGGNALAIAAVWPDTRVHGIDLAEQPIAGARATADAVGIANATFEARDVRDDADLGEYDYVIAHGLYAWVPADVRGAVLALIGRHLAPDGLAFISYTAHPGGALARALRDAALWHVRGVDDPVERGTRATELFQLLRDARETAGSDAYTGTFKRIVDDLAGTAPEVQHHDILAEAWDPVWFADFAADAGRHGLAYVDEAYLRRARPPAVIAMLERLGGHTRVEREQYVDILLARRFRTSLLCRADRAPSDDVDLERLRELRFMAGDRGNDEAVTALEASRPRAVPFDALDLTPAALWAACGAGAVIPVVHGPPGVSEPGERPRVHRLARFQAAHGRPVTTLNGSFLRVEDHGSRTVITLLDGTRDRDTVAADLERAAGIRIAPDVLETNLRALAASGLLDQ